jgi:hypothetical protein
MKSREFLNFEMMGAATLQALHTLYRRGKQTHPEADGLVEAAVGNRPFLGRDDRVPGSTVPARGPAFLVLHLSTRGSHITGVTRTNTRRGRVH